MRKASVNDTFDIYAMIKEIGPGENGFGNTAYKMEKAEFPNYLKRRVEMEKGIGLSDQYVPETTYWLIKNNRPVGISKLRHYFNEKLREHGGHIDVG